MVSSSVENYQIDCIYIRSGSNVMTYLMYDRYNIEVDIDEDFLYIIAYYKLIHHVSLPIHTDLQQLRHLYLSFLKVILESRSATSFHPGRTKIVGKRGQAMRRARRREIPCRGEIFFVAANGEK